ncbi:MAG: 2Fe-2S iron-sulfur cluster-binding protein, partial [Promethearchaeota archaeon]
MDLKNRDIIIDLEPISRRVFVLSDITFFEMLSDLRIQIRSVCGGMGTCGKCKILIQKGKEFLNPPTQAEKKLLDLKDLEFGWRLACQTKIDTEKRSLIEKIQPPQFRIFLPNELLLEDFKILTSGTSKDISLNPTVKKYFLSVQKPSLNNQIPDFERIVAELIAVDSSLRNKTHFNIEHNLLNNLPEILRENDHKITVTLWNSNTIIACEAGDTEKDNYGIAFDIGTTTIVGYLINLE